MGRLIDGDSFEAGIKILFGESNPIIHMVINKLHDQPTVEAISKADYENRLKADMVAVLEELKSYIDLMASLETDPLFAGGEKYCAEIIQQKIDTLRGNKDETMAL